MSGAQAIDMDNVGFSKAKADHGSGKKTGTVSMDHVLLALRETTDERDLRIQSLFNFFDATNNGYLDYSHIEAGLSALQIPPENKYAKELFKGSLSAGSVISIWTMAKDDRVLAMEVAKTDHMLNHDTRSCNRVISNQWLVQFQQTHAAWYVATAVFTVGHPRLVFRGRVLCSVDSQTQAARAYRKLRF